jgi:putative transposase
MTDNTVTPLVHPGEFTDMLTDVLRTGARQLLAHAVEAEVECFIEEYADHRLEDGRARIVRHGHFPERDIQTGIGAVRCGAVRCGTGRATTGPRSGWG